MKSRLLETDQWFPAARIDEVFDFFADAFNLNSITPCWLDFRILTPPPVRMSAGTIIEYRLRWRGLPIFWQTKIEEWQPPHRFVDCQIRGPYRKWRHEHIFEVRDGGVAVQDRVEYAIAGSILEPFLHRFLVGNDIARIFAFRAARLATLLGESRGDAC